MKSKKYELWQDANGCQYYAGILSAKKTDFSNAENYGRYSFLRYLILLLFILRGNKVHRVGILSLSGTMSGTKS